jgi:C4-dicarboxylate-specific signal transduction histidine kinase
MVIKTNFKREIAYVKNISNNIINYIDHKNLYDPKVRNEIEKTLSLFVTNRYKYIYIVDRSNKEYRFLVDGSKEDKASFLEPYEPYEIKEWNRVFQTKKENYFTHKKIRDLWITYLKPIVIDNKIEAILVIDFSMKEHSKISNVLNKLSEIFKLFLYFFVIIFGSIVWFSFIDISREKEKLKAQRELENSLKELEELNSTLEEKVKEEVDKNRQKDKQLLYQSRLAQMGEMMSMIAHQWRQPLASIASIALSLRLKTELGIVDKTFIQQKTELITQNTDYLSKTIDDFRNFFQPTKEKEITTFEKILNSVLDIANISLQNRNIKIYQKIEYNREIRIFVNELKQVILNIIKNAEDVLVERGIKDREIYISTYKKGSKIVLAIEDSGGGIDNKIMDKIFEPYFSTKDSKNGTGLGLYMSKIIVEEHLKGELRVSNSQKGALFEIVLKDEDGF